MIHANLAKTQKDWIRAYREASEAVRLAPESPYAHGLRCTVCYHSRLAECAAREAGIFVRMRPQDASAYIVLGHALEMRGDFAESLESHKTAERLHAGYSAIYQRMGRVYSQMGDFGQAVGAFEQAIRIAVGFG